MGLLEIQAEQEAEAARSAEAARAVPAGRLGKGKPKSDGGQPTRAGPSQPGQPRVLQVHPIPYTLTRTVYELLVSHQVQVCM